MIKQGPLLSAWIAYQLTNPPKTIRLLERVDANNQASRCCLGNLCHITTVRGEATFQRAQREDGVVIYGIDGQVLPLELADLIEITPNGALTPKGEAEALRYLERERIAGSRNLISSLANINDYTQADHAQIGGLIQHLAKVEADTGEGMFKDKFQVDAGKEACKP